MDRGGTMLEDWKRTTVRRWNDEDAFRREHGRTIEEVEKQLERMRLACGPGMEGILTP
ncbi:hypothetical protein MCP_1922 [Methanocella paludicola SANAE]|uniref:Uncharacterized protein n=1 Tax=Methanocella paludicola (strain DSM 17711 / JCM 13418 / NBRC 101707 / SANAE) TaxID=304371 RepID=D1YZX2_METPS|nr:hypothetical protein MCP_1922 [Methanocella paludicola SANAE]